MERSSRKCMVFSTGRGSLCTMSTASPRYCPRNPPAHFAGIDDRRLCRDPGGTVNPSNGKLACMESRTHPVRLADEPDETAFRGPDLLTAEEAAVYLRVAPKWVYANGPPRTPDGLQRRG